MLTITKIDINNENGRILWDNVTGSFSDSSIYQTVEYTGTVMRHKGTNEYLIFKAGNDIVGATAVRVYRIMNVLPVAAYVFRGPMLHPEWVKDARLLWHEFIQVLKNEYVTKRKMYLRIAPGIMVSDDPDISLNEPGTPNMWVTDIQATGTFVIDLEPDIETIKAAMHKQWRYNLKKSEKAGLTVREFTAPDVFDEFTTLYGEMHQRKNFQKNVSIALFREVQACLPDNRKMKVALSYNGNELVGGIIWSVAGTIGIPIFSATNLSGRDLLAGYQLRWHALCDIKNSGCNYFDQGGVDMNSNSGGYEFKSRMGGKEIKFGGILHAAPNRMMENIIKAFAMSK